MSLLGCFSFLRGNALYLGFIKMPVIVEGENAQFLKKNLFGFSHQTAIEAYKDSVDGPVIG